MCYTLLLIFCFVAIALAAKTKKQGIELAELKKEKALVLMVPELEKQLKSKEEQAPNAKLPTKEGNFVLTGIFLKGERKIAMINGKICFEGDALNGYLISKISPKAVILRNVSTAKEIKLGF